MRLIARLSVVAVLVAIGATLNATTVEYPEKHPAFTITLPDGWKATVDQEGNLDCEAGDGSDFGFSIMRTEGRPGMTTEAELKDYLPTLAKEVAGAKIENLDVGAIQEMTTPKNVKLFGVNATGRAAGVDMVISVASFAPQPGTYFVLTSAAVAQVDKAHEKEMNEIVRSITPVVAKPAE
jgi:hypothetical protein